MYCSNGPPMTTQFEQDHAALHSKPCMAREWFDILQLFVHLRTVLWRILEWTEGKGVSQKRCILFSHCCDYSGV